MGASAGQIDIDLNLNSDGFRSQLNSIQSMATKAAKVIAGAFAIKSLVNFGKQAIELASDLAEVQNVVDVTFPSMSREVDKFAQSAAASFGLSETMAKRFTGTFGSMAKAFGFTEAEALKMSTTLTGLAGDVASFYNISQDLAYTKLKSVFSGETESLKDLGIVMTQAALNEYALSRGINKTVNQMSEAEKVALRYSFVQDQLANATGDFSRTSGGWANQVRILSLQFDSLKAVIGQGLIAALTPIIQVVNTVIARILSLANAVKGLFSLFGSGTSGQSAMAAQASSMADLAGASEDAGQALGGAGKSAGGAGKAAKKAAQDIKSASTGIDELNILTQNDASDGGSGGGSGGGGGANADTYDLGELDTSSMEESVSSINPLLEGIINRISELAGLVQQGFWDALGDTSVFDSIKSNVDSILNSLKEIFTSPDVLAAANNFADTVAYNMGRVAGSMVSIAASIVDNLTGGLAMYLEQNTSRIQDFIIRWFDVAGRLSTIVADIWQAFAKIFTVFRSKEAKKLTSDIIGIFANATMGVISLAQSFGTDILDVLTGPFVNNADLIAETLQGLIAVIEPVFASIKQLVDDTVDKMLSVYDEHVHPLFESLKNGLSEILEVLLMAFNEYILPVIEDLGGRLSGFMSGYLQPLINNTLDFLATLIDAIKDLWEGVIVPLIEWLIKNLVPSVANVTSTIIDAVMPILETVTDVISGIIEALTGVIDFVVGVFTGDWERAWEGIKGILSGVWKAMKGLVETVINIIIGIISTGWSLVSNIFTTVWNAIFALITLIWERMKSVIQTVLNAISNIIQTVWNVVSNVFTTVWNAILSFIQTILETIRTVFSTVFEAISSTISTVWETVSNVTITIWEAISSTLSTIWETIKSTISSAVEAVSSTVSSVFEAMSSTVGSVFEGMWNVIRGVINSIIGGVEAMANGVINALNGMIDALNNLSFDVPEWVPGIGGNTFGFSIPNLSTVSIPRLATGGYVKANTPQLAMIGDNRHYGEIVAPEDKLQDMVNTAVSMVASQNNGMSEQLLGNVVNVLERLLDTVSAMDLTVQVDTRDIKKSIDELEKRRGYTLRG